MGVGVAVGVCVAVGVTVGVRVVDGRHRGRWCGRCLIAVEQAQAVEVAGPVMRRNEVGIQPVN